TSARKASANLLREPCRSGYDRRARQCFSKPQADIITYITYLEKDRGRKFTREEINLSLDQARAIGSLGGQPRKRRHDPVRCHSNVAARRCIEGGGKISAIEPTRNYP